MSVINLDQQLDIENVVTVRLAGKDYKLIFNDEFAKKLSEADLKITNYESKVNDLDVDNMTPKEQRKVLMEGYATANDAAVQALDSVLGKGEGKRLYNYYHQSTDVLAELIGKLRDLANNTVKERENRKERRKAKYTK